MWRSLPRSCASTTASTTICCSRLAAPSSHSISRLTLSSLLTPASLALALTLTHLHLPLKSQRLAEEEQLKARLEAEHAAKLAQATGSLVPELEAARKAQAELERQLREAQAALEAAQRGERTARQMAAEAEHECKLATAEAVSCRSEAERSRAEADKERCASQVALQQSQVAQQEVEAARAEMMRMRQLVDETNAAHRLTEGKLEAAEEALRCGNKDLEQLRADAARGLAMSKEARRLQVA